MIKEKDERKPSGDSRKAVYSIAAKSLDRAICVHFSYDRLDTVTSVFHNYDFQHLPHTIKGIKAWNMLCYIN